MGGLSKKAFQIKTLAEHGDGLPHVVLDAGNLLFKRNTLTPGQERQERATAKAIAKAYDAMGYDAVAVGGQDLAAGLAFLEALRKESKFTWLSANLVRKSDRKALMKPWVSVKAGAMRVAVIGLTGPALLQGADDAAILPWDQVLPTLMANIGQDHDLVILLSNLGVADNRRIAESYDNIHVLLQTGLANFVSADPINNTVMASVAPQGKQLGVMEIDWRPGKRWGTQRGELLNRKKDTLAQVRLQLSRFRQEREPEEALRNRPEQLGIYRMLLAREQEYQRDIERMTKEVEAQGPVAERASSWHNRFAAMEVTLPDQPKVSALVSDLKREIDRIGKAQRPEDRATAPAATIPPYLGSAGCRVCHAVQYAAWQKSRHAGAYDSLVRKRQHLAPECLPCHVTGLAVTEGEAALALPPERRGVGCESCHGPGRRHSERPKTVLLPRKPAPGVCRSCHSPQRDPDFDYAKKIGRVGH